MRTRKEIMDEHEEKFIGASELMLEVLLDIRDALYT